MPLFGKKKDKSSTILKTYEKMVNDGFEAAARGDTEKAILTFRKLLRWVTEDLDKIMKLSDKDKVKLSDLLTTAGEEMIKLKEYDVAVKILEKAKTINPKNFRAWMDIGRDLLQRNTQVPYALVCLREAAKLEPENIEVHLLLGDAYRIQGQLEKALAAYQKALKVDPENEDALQKVLKIQPENIDILERYIKVLERKGNKDELIKAYNRIVSITGDREYLERGLQLDPNNKDLLMNKARILLREEKIDEAKEIVKKLREEYPDDPDIKMLYDELMPEEHGEEMPEEVESIEVGELFGDISLGEAVAVGFEEESFNIEGEEAAEEAPETPEITEVPEAPAPPEGEGVSAPEVEETPKAPEVAMAETAKSEAAEIPEEAPPQVEEISEAPVVEEKVEEPVEEKVEIPPEDMFMQLYGERKRDEAAALLKEMPEESILKLLDENPHVLKFVYEVLKESDKKDLAYRFIEKLVEVESTEDNMLEKAWILIEMGRMDEAEKELNEIVKRNMKNGKALYLKARIMSVKGNDMGARNFLMMATKFNPELKEKAREDPYLEKYRDKDWFKKITS